jgi:transposase
MHYLKTRYVSVFEYLNMTRSLRKIAIKYSIGRSTLARWVNIEVSKRLPAKRKSWTRLKPTLTTMCSPHVQNILSRNAFAHVDDIRRELHAITGLLVSRSTVARCRREAGFTFKLSCRSQDHQRADRQHPFFADKDIYDHDTISIDESSFVSCDSTRRGWALRGKHVFKQPPRSRKRVSLLLAIDRHGVVAASMKFGSYNSVAFAEFLKSLPVNKRVLLDNASIHRTAIVRQTARDKNLQLIYTPPYCPWFNPVEHAFSVAKSTYRRARVLSTSPFQNDVVASLNRLTAESCNGFFEGGRKARLREFQNVET